MKLPNIRQTDVVIIAGKRGSGKTTLMLELLKTQIEYKRYVIFDVMKQYGNFGLVCTNSTDLKLAMKFREPKIIFQPVNISVDACELMCLLAYTYREYFVIIEEADRVAYTNSIGAHHSNLLDTGRHHSIGVAELSRKVNRLHTLPSSQATHFFIFKTFLPADVDYLAKFLPPTLVEKIPLLDQYECAYYNAETDDQYLISTRK